VFAISERGGVVELEELLPLSSISKMTSLAAESTHMRLLY